MEMQWHSKAHQGTYSLHSGPWIDHPDRHMSCSSISLPQLLCCQDIHSEKGDFLYAPVYERKSIYYLPISNSMLYGRFLEVATCFICSSNWVSFPLDPVDVLLRNC